MARTHGATQNAQPTSRFHQDYDDGGTLLGKGGEPIPTSPTRGIPTLYPHGQPTETRGDSDVVERPTVVPMQPVPAEFVWVCDQSTWQRNMDGWVIMQILNAMMGPLSLTLTDEQARKLPSDCRHHFRRRPKPEVSWDDPEPVESPEARVTRLEAELADLRELVGDFTSRPVDRPVPAAPVAVGMTKGEKIMAGKVRAQAAREAVARGAEDVGEASHVEHPEDVE